MILIVTIKDDIHALEVAAALKKAGHRACHILESDDVADSETISWSADQSGTRSSLRDRDGARVRVEDANVVWWRRGRGTQNVHAANALRSSQAQELIVNDCRGAFIGALLRAQDATWVSPIDATDRASNKLYQLSVAAKCGFRIPATLVSQEVGRVKEFCAQHGKVIAKTVVGANGASFFTEVFSYEDAHPDSIRACPTIYQEYIAGTRHIRMNVFGESCFAASIDTEDLDWRGNLNVPVRPWDVPPDVAEKVRAVLRALDLRMGIIDLKIDAAGEPVWLEVNPQGQFLFIEKLAGLPLSDAMSRFLAKAESGAVA